MLVPSRPDDPAAAPNRKAWEILRQWTRPFRTAIGDEDPITRGAEKIFQREIPIAGHFLQENRGEQLVEVVIAFCGR